jgi:glycosyltransferase involved in cell wall biosynthesis
MNNIKVSVCIPTYLQTEFLKKTLDSIMIQKFKDYEIVITDDSPNDSVKNLIESYNFENRLKYYKNEKKLGSPENWNRAIESAQGDYLKIMHHDDWFTNNDSLEKFVDLLDHNPKADFAFSSTLVWDIKNNNKRINRIQKKSLHRLSKNPESLFFGNIIGAPSATIFRRNIHEIFDKKIKWVVDIDFYIRLLKKNSIFGYCDKPLICTPDKAPHQITQLCINNKAIELFEYIYLFQKIYNKDIKLFKYYIFFINLFKKYNVISMDIFNQQNIKPYPIEFFKKVLKFKKILELKGKIFRI